MKGPYKAIDIFALVHAETAKVHATFAADFYAGRPALTSNAHGKGTAWYIASRNEQAFQDDFYRYIAATLKLTRALDADLPAGVSATCRTDGKRQFFFIMNFNSTPTALRLGTATYTDLLTGTAIPAHLSLAPYDVRILTRL